MTTNPPTFDEWYEATYGTHFDVRWMAHGVTIESAMRALSIALREYTTEIARLMALTPAPPARAHAFDPAERLGFEPFEWAERS